MSDLRTELMAVREQYGSLTAENVVDAARHVNSPLHTHFEWDDGEAAHRYRLQQARQLIRVVRQPYVTAGGMEERVRTFHSLPGAGEGGKPAYEPLDEIIEDPVATEVMIRQAEREWRTMWARYSHLREFVDIVRGSVSITDPVKSDGDGLGAGAA